MNKSEVSRKPESLLYDSQIMMYIIDMSYKNRRHSCSTLQSYSKRETCTVDPLHTKAFPRHNRYAAPPWCEAVSCHQAEKVSCWSKALLECEADDTRRFTESIIPITKDKMAANLFAGVLAFWDKLDMDMFLKDQEKPAATSSSANETSAASSCIHRTADACRC